LHAERSVRTAPFRLPVSECRRRPAMKTLIRHAAFGAALLLGAAASPAQERATLPILVPITGALALEGQSQRDGALLAFESLKQGPAFNHPVIDTGSNPQIAVQAFERAMGESPKPRALMGPIDGNSMLALLPLAAREKLALIAVSGTARLTELGSKEIFRFFPSDVVVKAAQARYAVEELKRTKVALVYQNTAYGQSGNEQGAFRRDRSGARFGRRRGRAAAPFRLERAVRAAGGARRARSSHRRRLG